jgi:hypothetical protein
VLEDKVSTLETKVSTLEARWVPLDTLFAGVTRGVNAVTSEDTLLFTGMNVQLVKRSGQTDSSANGAGNLILGYNTSTVGAGDQKTGSHDLIVGDQHTYTRTSGVVAGLNNTLSNDWAFVAGGFRNTASGLQSFVGGAHDNLASAEESCGRRPRQHGQWPDVLRPGRRRQPGKRPQVACGRR